MNLAGVPIATENASKACKDAAIYVTKKSGGNGAFREAIEWILSKQGALENTLEELRIKVQNQ
jgi:3-deoxy-D-manno-octulosonate 8-phosphate phosphatase (KDO 8-P phosphatase)